MSRTRRVIKIVGPLRVTVSIVIAIVLTVLVAWWIHGKAPGRGLNSSAVWGGECVAYSPPRDSNPELSVLHTWTQSLGYTKARTLEIETSYIEKERSVRATHGEVYEALVGKETSFDRVPGFIRGIEYAERVVGSPYERCRIYESCYGFPFPCLAKQSSFGHKDYEAFSKAAEVSSSVPAMPGRDVVTGEIDVRPDVAKWLRLGAPFQGGRGMRVTVPVSVVPGAFIANVFLYGVALYGLLSFPACVSGIYRRRTNRCRACGYSLTGLAGGSCPECGFAIRRRVTAS